MNRVDRISQILVCLGLVLAALIGGQLSVGQEIMPGESLWSAIADSAGAAMLAHAVIALPFAATAIILYKRRILHLPSPGFCTALIILLVFIATSVFTSQHRPVSLGVAAEWSAYVVVFGAVLTAIGRGKGPQIALAAIVAGAALVSIKGIQEYSIQRLIDPTWRIFAGWINQNALAGMLILALFPCLSQTLVGSRQSRLTAGAAGVLITMALLLSQSKGGLAAAAVGAGVWIALTLFRRSPKSLGALVPLAIGGALVLAIQLRQPTSAGPSVLNRLVNAGATQEQSSGFRKLLWSGSVDIIAKNPQGVGIGTYSYHSAKPGLTQTTHLAHQSYLQLAAEASPLALLSLVIALGLWLIGVLRGFRSLEPERAAMLIGVIAAVTASCAHNLVDSDWYHFGLGVIFFALLALGFCLAADGSGPENLPRPIRFLLHMPLTLFAIATMLVLGWTEYQRNQLSGAIQAGDAATATQLSESLSYATWDGEVDYWKAMISQNGRLPLLQSAATKHPTLKIYRALAREARAQNQAGVAISALNKALKIDPNNLPTLLQSARMLFDAGDPGFVQAARRLIAVESSTYYKVRAIPELVPTETFDVRLLLAEKAPKEAPTLYKEAALGYHRFLQSTYPRVEMLAKTDPRMAFGGVNMSDAIEVLRRGLLACNMALKGGEVPEVSAAKVDFESALASVPASVGP